MPVFTIDSALTLPRDLMLLMTYPDDEPTRTIARATEMLKFRIATAGKGETIALSIAEATSLLHAPSLDAQRTNAADRTKRAFVAGDILMLVYLMDLFSLKPSINRAIFAFQAYAKQTTYGDNSQIVTSESAIRDCWKQFAPVAHFWAAIRINEGYPFAPPKECFAPEHIGALLSVAAGLYQFATTFVAPRARPPLPIVDRASAWALPPNIQPMRLVSDRFPTRIVEFLKGYKAPIPVA